MGIQTISILIVIGLLAGILSGFVGIGGGIIIVPALIYFMGLGQHEAQGTSLFLMLPPIGILAAYNYYRAEQMNIWFGIVIAIFFVLGGYLGSRWSLKIDPSLVRLIFGLFMLYVATKMIISGFKEVVK